MFDDHESIHDAPHNLSWGREAMPHHGLLLSHGLSVTVAGRARLTGSLSGPRAGLPVVTRSCPGLRPRLRLSALRGSGK